MEITTNLFLLTLTLLLAHAIAVDNNPPDTDKKVTDCRKYSDLGKVANCYGTQYTQGYITNTTFKAGLQYIIGKLPTMFEYHSMGFTTGTEIRLLAGTQVDPSFKRTLVNIGLDPRNVYTQGIPLDLGISTHKPIMLFLTNANQHDLPTLPSMLTTYTTIGGERAIKRLFKASGAGDFKENAEENCGDWYSKWEHRENAERMRGVAVVMDPKLWCRTGVTEKFEVVVASLARKENGVIDVMTAEWAISKDNKFGDVPQSYQSVFL